MTKKTSKVSKKLQQKENISSETKLKDNNKVKNNNKNIKTAKILSEELFNQENLNNFIDYIIKILQNKNAFNIIVINTPDYLTDYFIIASVDNKVTLEAISKYFINEFMLEISNKNFRKFFEDIKIGFDGTYDSGWVVIDLYYFWIHLFLPEVREKYSIERLWNLRNTMRQLSDSNNDNNNEDNYENNEE